MGERMETGRIIKALAGFYYVKSGEQVYECRARGKFRLDGTSPLVGDIVDISTEDNFKGTVAHVHGRHNSFLRPAVANVDCLVILAAAVNPITDPFLIDRVTSVAEDKGCSIIICINKADLDPGDRLFEIYSKTPYKVLRTSATTGEGIADLCELMAGKLCTFTGNSGVGKSSLLNAICPQLQLKVGEVSDKLGRGKHTTRHVELFYLPNGAFIADTPGFSSFDIDKTEHISRENLQYCFSEFSPFLGQCRFLDCAHIKEPGCCILDAVERGVISPSRHESYIRLYDLASKVKDWEIKTK